MSAPLIVVLEGPDGCGKTTHAHHLALALRRKGVSAHTWEHLKPPEECRTPYSRALWYALQRSRLVDRITTDPTAVWIVDRWCWSTLVIAQTTAPWPDNAALHQVYSSEVARGLALPRTILLTAPLAEIERRLVARGESTTGMDAVRAEYLRLAEIYDWPTVDTTAPREQVTAQLVQIVRGWL